jgi:solute carrier family 25 (mitochondrial oxoglutarate transporter), member 11
MSQGEPAKKSPSTWSIIQPFVIGGFSGITATCFIQPVDMIKVRIQIKAEELAKTGQKGSVSPFAMITEINKTSGIGGFYKGIDSAIARQVFYTTSRLGIYKSLFDYFKTPDGKVSSGNKVVCALTAGFLGSLIGNPADLALIRMQADTALPLDQRRNYKNVFNAFSRIVSEEGLFALWKGCEPTVVRAMVLNLGMLAPYDEVKERLNQHFGTVDTVETRLISSATAGLLSSFMSLPFDNVKTKLQKMKPDAQGKLAYSGIVDCFTKSIKNEGVTGLWVGFPTYYFRIAPHVMITLMVQDALTAYFKKSSN